MARKLGDRDARGRPNLPYASGEELAFDLKRLRSDAPARRRSGWLPRSVWALASAVSFAALVGAGIALWPLSEPPETSTPDQAVLSVAVLPFDKLPEHVA